MNKTDILEALNKFKTDNIKNDSLVSKKVILEGLQNVSGIKKPDGKSKFMDNIRETLNSNLANPDKEIKFESWKPQATSLKALSRRILIEAELENNKPNAFRLNLMPITLDISHGKFQAIRNGKTAIFELLYPNAKGKITVKVQVDGCDDKIVEVGLEDSEYVGNLGVYIIKLIDECIAQSVEGQQDEMNDYMNAGGEYATPPGSGLGKGSFPPTWQAMGEADMRKIASLMEAPDDEEDVKPDDESMVALGDDPSASGEEGDGEGEFGEDDFSVDAGGVGTEMGDFTSDFGGDFGGGGGGGGGGSDFGGDEGEVNAEEGEISMEEDVNYMTFRDKADWLNSSIDTMQKLVSQSVASKMQDGSGVIMTSDEILNGSAGLKGDTNFDVIDKFLKVYPELDSIDLTEEQLNQIEDKLSLDDGQFDSWLQQNLPEFSGQEEVNETLNNEMFDDFEPMGGEPDVGGEAPTPPEGDFNELVDKAVSEEDDEVTPEFKEAELEIGGTKSDEFPGLDSNEENPKPKVK